MKVDIRRMRERGRGREIEVERGVLNDLVSNA